MGFATSGDDRGGKLDDGRTDAMERGGEEREGIWDEGCAVIEAGLE